MKQQQTSYHITVKIKEQAFMKNARALLIYQHFHQIGHISHLTPTYEQMEQDVEFAGTFTMHLITDVQQQEFEKIKHMPDVEDIIILREQKEVPVITAPTPNELTLLGAPQEDIPQACATVERENAVLSVKSHADIVEEELQTIRYLTEELIIDQARLVTINDVMNRHATSYKQTHVQQLNDITHHLQRVINDLQVSVKHTYERSLHQLLESLCSTLDSTMKFELIGEDVMVDYMLLQYFEPAFELFFFDMLQHDISQITIRSEQKQHMLMLCIMMQFDIYQQNIEQALETLTKSIQTHSTLHVITEDVYVTIQISMPLTSSIASALLVQLVDETFVVPLLHITELLRISSVDIQRVGSKEVTHVRGQLLPLVRISHTLQLTDETSYKKREIVIVAVINDHHVGIIVDKVSSKQNIVMKPLSTYIGTPPYIAGAAIIGSGDVAMVLDIEQILSKHGAKFEQLINT